MGVTSLYFCCVLGVRRESLLLLIQAKVWIAKDTNPGIDDDGVVGFHGLSMETAKNIKQILTNIYHKLYKQKVRIASKNKHIQYVLLGCILPVF
jgi:hypothetical protein